jgi:hypothetical protein
MLFYFNIKSWKIFFIILFNYLSCLISLGPFLNSIQIEIFGYYWIFLQHARKKLNSSKDDSFKKFYLLMYTLFEIFKWLYG